MKQDEKTRLFASLPSSNVSSGYPYNRTPKPNPNPNPTPSELQTLRQSLDTVRARLSAIQKKLESDQAEQTELIEELQTETTKLRDRNGTLPPLIQDYERRLQQMVGTTGGIVSKSQLEQRETFLNKYADELEAEKEKPRQEVTTVKEQPPAVGVSDGWQQTARSDLKIDTRQAYGISQNTGDRNSQGSVHAGYTSEPKKSPKHAYGGSQNTGARYPQEYSQTDFITGSNSPAYNALYNSGTTSGLSYGWQQTGQYESKSSSKQTYNLPQNTDYRHQQGYSRTGYPSGFAASGYNAQNKAGTVSAPFSKSQPRMPTSTGTGGIPSSTSTSTRGRQSTSTEASRQIHSQYKNSW